MRRAMAWTMCESPKGTNEELRLDTYKKWVSGDKMMGRPPYGKTTRMYHIEGLKRFERNSILHFNNVAEEEVESIMCRCIIIVLACKFYSPAWIDKHMPKNHEDYASSRGSGTWRGS